MSFLRLTSVRDRDFVESLILASFLAMAPYSYLGSGLEQYLILSLALVLTGMISRVLFSAAIILLVFISTIAVHLKTTWGLSFLESRIEVALIAPGFEVVEYVRSYLGLTDALLLACNIVLLFFCFRAVGRFKDRSLLLHAVSVAILVPIVTTFLVAKHHRIPGFLPVKFVTITYETIARLNKVGSRHIAVQTPGAGSSCGTGPYDTVVVVLGEAVLKDRMGIYGYTKPTTPFLESIDPFVFDAISPGNQTRFSVPMMLTSATASDFAPFYHSPSIITRLKNCGFDTYWVSNQGRVGRYETNITTIAMEADHTVFANNLGYQQSGYDGDIVKRLVEVVDTSSAKRAIFVHLLGSHSAYDRRYPKDYALSLALDVESHYDNSIYYSDHVLSEIYENFRSDDLLFVYVSDHGEVVTNEEFGHGYYPSYRDEFRIPLIVWSKHEERPSKVMESSRGRVINTESFDHLLTYLIGMDNEAGLSFSRSVFSLDPANKMDYAKLKEYGAERALLAAAQPTPDRINAISVRISTD